MKINLFIFLYYSTLILLTSCQLKETELDSALKLSGDNRSELESVLKHYAQKPSDSLKYKAACFLIENIPYYSYYEGELLDNYLLLYKELAINNKEPQAIIDSFTIKYGRFSVGQLNLKYEITEIKAKSIINNIEWAFKVWKEQPWGKNVTFENFCEYILPHRIKDEKPSEWRQKLYEKYNPLLDSIRNIPEASDPLFAAQVLMDTLCKFDKKFTSILPPIPHIGPTLCDQWKSGSCRELTDLTIYIFRSLGIPCGTDFMSVHARGNSGHSWAFILDKNGETHTSDYLNCNILPIDESIYGTARVFRSTFSINKELQKQMRNIESDIYPSFTYPKFLDLTSYYAGKYPTHKFTIPDSAWYTQINRKKIAYLCVVSKEKWVPVTWCQLDKENTHFDALKNETLYRVATWEDNQLNFQTDPFVLNELNGILISVTFLKAQKDTETITLYSKFDPDNPDGFMSRMINGVVEADNNLKFNCPDTLYTVKRKPIRLFNKELLSNNKKYRYYRYKGPENSYCNISEITFYENSENWLPCTGKIIGTTNSYESNDYTSALDGDPYTSFNYKHQTGGWVGIDLGQPKQIKGLSYTPRNRDNFIHSGDTYELFYLNKKWISAGVQTATSDSLVYQDIPTATLLFLKNRTRGIDERIFTYKNGEQIWW